MVLVPDVAATERKLATATFAGSRRPFHLYGGCRATITGDVVLQLPTFIGGLKFPSPSWQAGNYTRTMKSSANILALLRKKKCQQDCTWERCGNVSRCDIATCFIYTSEARRDQTKTNPCTRSKRGSKPQLRRDQKEKK